uniref:Uncharacterized protein n=1 Tax=Zea mays TaxID=4577 RepID=C4J328_MAIZE|nr:unknown [Zea mays]
MGTLSTMPRMLALMARQRQTAASRSASPCSNGQHCSSSGTPMFSLSRFSTFAHTSSFSASIGQLPAEPLPPPPPPPSDGGGCGVVGVGVIGGDGQLVLPPSAAAERRKVVARMRSASLAAISRSVALLYCVFRFSTCRALLGQAPS